MNRFMFPAGLTLIFFLCIVSSVASIGTGLQTAKKVFAVAEHPVISEIRTSGVTPSDEFVELYNPENVAVDMTGWKLKKKSSGGTVATMVADIALSIAPHGYVLIAQTNYQGTTPSDRTYAVTLGDDNTILLYDSGDQIVDKVGIGESANDPEASPAVQPEAETSIERKASAISTAVSMAPGGAEEFSGNGEDSGNNASDFFVRDTPQPQGAQSPAEPVIISPTNAPEPTYTPAPVPTEVPTPALSPTPEPSPTLTPPQTPTPAPTPSPMLTPLPSAPPSTPTPSQPAEHGHRRVTCRIMYYPFRILSYLILIPRLSCSRGSWH